MVFDLVSSYIVFWVLNWFEFWGGCWYVKEGFYVEIESFEMKNDVIFFFFC